MGNRAVITWSKEKDVKKSEDIGVYLHWNGGRDSVEGFLKYCELRGFREPDSDNYGLARFIQVIANFFGGEGISIGVDKCCNLDCDNYDNGVYICEGWGIVGRQNFNGIEQNEHDLRELIEDIDTSQPTSQRLGAEYFEKKN